MQDGVSGGEALIIAVILLCIAIWSGTWFAEKMARSVEPIPEPSEQEDNWFIVADASEASRKIQAGADLCWRQARNGDNGERLCQAYQQAAGHIEAAVSLIRRAT